MRKSERPKSGKRYNLKECWFGFWHIPISAARALMNKPNLSEIGTFQCRTENTVRNLNDFVRISHCLITKLSENGREVNHPRRELVWISDVRCTEIFKD